VNDHPAQHAAVRLTDVAAELLDEAGGSPNQRAARTLIGGNAQRVTMIALLTGAALGDHITSPAASLQVLRGDVRLRAGDQEWALEQGSLIATPPQRHGVVARTDSVLLLTVAVD
jgi:quercetin dioxygenase-like cupin family protein